MTSSIGLPDRVLPKARAATSSPLFTAAVGVGSPTTEAVTGALTAAVQINSVSALSSIGATGTATVATKPTAPGGSSCVIDRPVNDDQGFAALMASGVSGSGCVDFARMSHPYTGPALNGVPVDYVPFAMDNLTFAVSASSQLPSSMSTAQLKQIYTCDPQMTGFRGLLPAEGSEQRQMWLAALGILDSDVVSGRYPCVSDHNSSGQYYGENNGGILDNNSVMPFSAASFLSQAGGSQTQQLAQARLGTISDLGQAPVAANSDAYPDDVSFAVTATGSVPRHISLHDLMSIYTCQTASVTPLLPASGSVRLAFESKVHIADADVTAGKYPCIQTTYAGASVQENYGVVLDANSIVPYSITAYVGQLLGTALDHRGAAQLGVIDPTGPAVNQGPLPMMLNTAYGAPFTYHVCNAVAHSAVNSSPINEAFSGSGALVCQQSVIQAFGFAPIAGGDAEPCGSLQHSTAANGLAAATVAARITPSAANKTAAATAGAHAARSAGSVKPAAAATAPYVSEAYPLTALDGGLLPGSGGTWWAQNGQCTISGGYHNVPGTSATVGLYGSFLVSGPRCHAYVTTTYYSVADGAPIGGEYLDQDCVLTCGLNLQHNGPGYYLQHLSDGRDYIYGNVLLSLSLNIVDDSFGGVGWTTDVYPFAQLGISSVIAGNPSPATVVLTWNTVPSATSYTIERIAGSQNAWTRVATLDQINAPQLQWQDPSTADEMKYTYRVTAFNLNNQILGPSFPVSVVPAATARIKHYAVLGDSYSAGVGVDASATFINNDTCHRSDSNYAGFVTDVLDNGSMSAYAPGDARWDIIACDGARTYNMLSYLPDNGGATIGHVQSGMEPWDSHVLGSRGADYLPADFQITMLAEATRRQPVDYVTLTVGGDDAGFADVLQDCVLHKNYCDDSTIGTYEAKERQLIDGLSNKLKDVYIAAAQASNYVTVDVLGYPHLFPDNGSDNCAMTFSAGLASILYNLFIHGFDITGPLGLAQSRWRCSTGSATSSTT
ncbi:MAG TPA: hypothetical protein VGS97_15495 [Actinocrinis sp.]|uniref:hypothetical protein n=1 Tax=Actinocrinis sp. TaxID=1920516 RepID=UPI002DDCD881|nr:hypothetical protein [Actinocrinis sp.]HEV2345502.1 hypothetical protein [Actinocrinis sp.]